jgi:hypothetical protein
MRTKILYLALGALLLTFGVLAEAQQPTKVPQIGFLAASPLSAIAARIEAFAKGSVSLGT